MLHQADQGGDSCPATASARRAAQPAPKIYAVLDDLSNLRATVGDLSRQIGQEATLRRRPLGCQRYVGKRLETIAKFTVWGNQKPDVFDVREKVGGSYPQSVPIRD